MKMPVDGDIGDEVCPIPWRDENIKSSWVWRLNSRSIRLTKLRALFRQHPQRLSPVKVIISSPRGSCACADGRTTSIRQLCANATAKKPVEVAYQHRLINIALAWRVQLLYTIYSPADHDLRACTRPTKRAIKTRRTARMKLPHGVRKASLSKSKHQKAWLITVDWNCVDGDCNAD